MKRENGITLIALIVTIIVLLILAGVTIATLTGDNGILGQVGKTKEKEDESNLKENIELEIAETKIEMELTGKELEDCSKKISKNEDGTFTYNSSNINAIFMITKDDKVIVGKKAKDADLSTGDYVNYNIDYENVPTYDNSYVSTLTGWRVLSKEISEDGLLVRLVSAGVPMTFWNYWEAQKASVPRMTNKFFSPESWTGSTYSIQDCGFYDNERNKITNIADLKVLFENPYTQIINDLPSVQSMTKSDLDLIMGKLTENETNIKNNDLIAVPSINEGYYSYYWLGTAYSREYL